MIDHMALRRRLSRFAALLLLLILLSLAWVVPAFADDCGRDPLNANDCLRTPGSAQAMAGTATTVIAVLVNGFQIARTVTTPTGPTGPKQPTKPKDRPSDDKKDDEKPPRRLNLRVEVRDDAGGMRTNLDATTDDRLRIRAWCEEVGKGPLPAATATVQFSLTAGRPWVTLSGGQMAGGSKTATLQSARAKGQPPANATVYVSASFEGQQVGGAVTIALSSSKYFIEIF